MNSIIKEALICLVLLFVLTTSFYLVLELFSNKAKIVEKRIKKYVIYGAILYSILIFGFKFNTFRQFILYTALFINCFLFEEERILTKVWKIIVVICIESLLEFVVNIFGDWFYYNVWESWIVYEFMVAVGTLLIIASAVGIVKKLNIYNHTKVESIIFSQAAAILLCILGICALCNPTIATLIYMYNDQLQINIVVVMLWAIGSTLASLCLILGVDKNIAQNYYQKVNELIETQFKNQVNYYQKIEESNQEIRAIKHDMKNHLISMQSLLHNSQLDDLDNYIDEIRNKIGKKVSLIRTGNTIVDAILNEKNAIAHEKNIAMDIKVGIEEEIGLEMIDLCIILSNSIDNAIEACERIEDVTKRRIIVICNYRAGYFLYKITNSMKDENIPALKNIFLTIKKDKKNHGFGVGNIKQSVKKYGGEVKTRAENFQFILEVEINTREALALQA